MSRRYMHTHASFREPRGTLFGNRGGGGGRSNSIDLAFYTEVSYSETPIERLCLEEPLKRTALL